MRAQANQPDDGRWCRASEHVETDEAVVGEAQSELNEAEEALRLAQLRVEAVRRPTGTRTRSMASLLIDSPAACSASSTAHCSTRACLPACPLSDCCLRFGEQAKQNFTVALSRLADSKLKKSASDAKMEAGSLIREYIAGMGTSQEAGQVHFVEHGTLSVCLSACAARAACSHGGQAGGQSPPQRAG